MRLWHQALIPYLPRQQLLGQHRECCALRGKGWGRKHKIVDYVFKHDFKYLYLYHSAIMDEILHRGYKINNDKWQRISYRGLKLGYDATIPDIDSLKDERLVFNSFKHERSVPHEQLLTMEWIYPEHDVEYLLDCLNNLKNKGVELNGISFEEMSILADLHAF